MANNSNIKSMQPNATDIGCSTEQLVDPSPESKKHTGMSFRILLSRLAHLRCDLVGHPNGFRGVAPVTHIMNVAAAGRGQENRFIVFLMILPWNSSSCLQGKISSAQ